MKQPTFPPGWDEERVRKVLAHYEEQTEDEAVAEDKAAMEESIQTVVVAMHAPSPDCIARRYHIWYHAFA